MIGAELVKDVESNKEPATARAADILTRLGGRPPGNV